MTSSTRMSRTALQRVLKLATFVVGLGALLYGALFLDYPDWDVGVSLVMSLGSCQPRCSPGNVA